jgi:single-stranded-DNA-specific exonuclease
MLLGYRVVGEKHLKMTLQCRHGNSKIDGIAFNTPQLPEDCQQVHLAYRLDANEFRGIVSPQLIVEYIEAIQQDPRA